MGRFVGLGHDGVVVIPVHDVNPVRRTPWVTYALVAINVAVLLLTPVALGTLMGSPGPAAQCRQAAFYDRYAAIPRELVRDRPLRLVPTGQTAVGAQGVGCVPERPTYRKSPPLSVLWSMFLHSGWLHLLGNMLFLVVFGNNIEDRMRKLPFLLFYLACGYASAYGFALANPHSVTPLIGASGAISGVLGAYLVLYPRARVWSLVPFLLFIPLRIPAWLVLGLWFLLQWAYSTGLASDGAGSVAYLAHVIGFLAGVLTGLVIRAASPQPAGPVGPGGLRRP
jgi:membrane associated rhomboid family serine protease